MMNERIKELAYQSGACAMFNNQLDKDNLDLEKFAELIVRECISLLPEDCQSDNGCHTSWTIKEHFGVE